jgi:hypothetical protein
MIEISKLIPVINNLSKSSSIKFDGSDNYNYIYYNKLLNFYNV